MDPYENSKIHTKRYKKLKKLLKSTYGYESFKPKQYEIINRIINSEDVCAVLPTGFGKSLTFQMPALYLDKPAIVVSPLISLMDDQRLILEKLGISSCCYNSAVEDKAQMKKDILQAKYKFIYITPESLVHMEGFFQKLEEKQGISLVAIDEAHCISSYGFDFRKSYRELTFLKKALPTVPILALTATATKNVAIDICKVLGFNSDNLIKTSFDRSNLYLEVRRKSGNISLDVSEIAKIIKEYKDQTAIIYCLTKKETEKIAEMLKIHEIKCAVYHSGLSDKKKKKAHNNFIKDKVRVVVATIAFGMGINKSNVRVVVHYGSPRNLEGYYQEIGRAGRDGEKSYCYAFYNYGDFKMQERFIAGNSDRNYQLVQSKLLEKMKQFMVTKKCRRQILLEYFDEEAADNCQFCDNCLGVKDKLDVEIVRTKQNVQKEAKMIISLIESIKNKSFGIGMYINILRGSNNKNVTSEFRKNPFFGKGKHRSVPWWKELSENLISRGFLQQVYLKSGRFPLQVLKTTRNGVVWATMADLSGLMDIGVQKLEPVEMVTTA